MKRKRFDRYIWNFGGFPYYQMRVDTDAFHGFVCLLKLMNGNIKVEGGQYQYWDRPKAGKVITEHKGIELKEMVFLHMGMKK